MQFGLRYCNTGRYVAAHEAVVLAQAAEAAGFESLWTVEHVIVPADYASAYPYDASGKMAGGRADIALPDPLIWMAFVAAATRQIKIATGILILPQHNPVLAAKQIATLDHLSCGRVMIGVGVGWLQEEFRALGVPFSERGPRRRSILQRCESFGRQIPPRSKGGSLPSRTPTAGHNR
jgi:alkanesulfonate monooxygenase SsuD/methylene tetrahydromethanopterin reductase-like flavin-dependent oxidoreductase (luciferase family)